MDAPVRCRSCGGPCPPGIELCPSCRTDRLPVLQLPSTRSAGVELSLPGLSEMPSSETPLCGRDLLLEQLSALGTEAARQSRVRFCLVVGAPGSGKTRLLGELERSLAVSGVRVLRGAATEGGPPLLPLHETLRQRFDIGPRDSAAEARDKLTAGCAQLLPGRSEEPAELLAELLDLPQGEDGAPWGSEGEPRPPRPARNEGRLYQALRKVLQADAAASPLAFLLDDMEHAQPEAVRLLHYLAAGLSGAPVFLCAFSRPEIDEVHPTFGQGEAPCDRLEVPPLGEANAVSLLDTLCHKAGPPPPEVTHHAAGQLGGSPRAIEELVRMLEDMGALVLEDREAPEPRPQRSQERARWVPARLPATLPASLEEIVAARLAVMEPPLRAVLEQAATAGERFFLEAVVALGRATEVGLGIADEDRRTEGPDPGRKGAPSADSGRGRDTDPDGPTLEEIVVAGDRTTKEVKDAIRKLCRRGLLVPLSHSSLRGEREYRFAYPPWRAVVYDAIAPARKRRYHALWAQWLDLSTEGAQGAQQETIGNHLLRAGQGDAAAARFLRAATIEKERYAHGPATRLLARAIACLGTADLGLRIRLWHELGTLFHLRGAYEDALSAYEKVVRLSWVIASRSKAAQALLHMGEVWQKKGELQLSLDYLGQALDLFQQAGDAAGESDVLDDIGQALWLAGRYEEALSRSAEALELRRRLGDRKKIAASLLSIGNIERHRGLLPAAAACYDEALALHRARGDRAGVAACLNAVGVLRSQRGDVPGARRCFEEALGHAEAVGVTPLVSVLQCHIGDNLLLLGQLPEAEARFRTAERLARELSDKRILSEAARALGTIALRRGDTKEAHGRCAEALRLAEEAGVRLDIARALLALGEVHAATLFDADSGRRRGESKALTYFRRAITLLRELGNPQELHLGLVREGRYHLESGDTDQGAALLREAEALCEKLKVEPGQELRELLAEL